MDYRPTAALQTPFSEVELEVAFMPSTAALSQGERLMFEIARSQGFAVVKNHEKVRSVWEEFCQHKGSSAVWIDERDDGDVVGVDLTTSTAWFDCPEKDRTALLQRTFVDLCVALNGPGAVARAEAAAGALRPAEEVRWAARKATIWDMPDEDDIRPQRPRAVWEPPPRTRAYEVVADWRGATLEVRQLSRQQSKQTARAVAAAVEAALARRAPR